MLIQMGFKATSTKASGDGGIDIIAINEQPIFGSKYVIQCKRYATGSNVGEPAIRDLYGVMHSENANKGILVTTSDFSNQAIIFAQNKAIELINGHALVAILNKYLTELEETSSLYISNKQTETYSAYFNKFMEDCDLILQRESYSVRNDRLQISLDAYFEKYCFQEEDIKDYLADLFLLFDFNSDLLSEEEGVGDKLLTHWRSFMEKQDIKVSKSFINEYIDKSLLLYKEYSKIDAQSMPEWSVVMVLPVLATMYKILKASKELEAFENPLLIKFLLKELNTIGIIQ